MRRVIACLSLLILLAPGTFVRSDPPYRDNSQTVSLVPVILNPERPQQKSVGALQFIAGWELRSTNGNFGGISSLRVLSQNQILALSDGGYLFSFSLDQNTNDNSSDTRSFIAPLPRQAGLRKGKETRDSESFVQDPVSGRYWVGFEDSNIIARYDAALTRIEAFHQPRTMRYWPSNSGPEAMVLLGTGSFLVFSEGQETGNGLTQALLFAGDPTNPQTRVVRFSYRAPLGYKATDAALLPDGRLIILNRRFTVLEGVSARIVVADPADIAAGSVLEGIVIAAMAPPITVDNMEAIAVTEENNEVIVWLASDDNFNSVQRSLLLKFQIDLEKVNSGTPFNPGLSSLQP